MKTLYNKSVKHLKTTTIQFSKTEKIKDKRHKVKSWKYLEVLIIGNEESEYPSLLLRNWKLTIHT